MVIHVSRSFLGFFKIPSCFLWFQVGIYGFSRFWVGFSMKNFHGSNWVFMGFQGSRLGFHGSRWVLRVIHDPMLV